MSAPRKSLAAVVLWLNVLATPLLLLQLIYNLLVGGRLCRLFRQNEPQSTRSTQSVGLTSATSDQGVGGASGQS